MNEASDPSGLNIVEEPKAKKLSKWGLVRALKTFLSVGVVLHSAKKLGCKGSGITHAAIANQFTAGNMKKPSPSRVNSPTLQGMPALQGINEIPEVSPRNSQRFRPEERTLPAFAKALEDFRIRQKFIQLVAIGGKFALDEMTEIIPKARGSFSRDASDPRHILSRRDQFGRAPIGRFLDL